MKGEARCAEWHTFFDILAIPEMHAKHSEMSLVSTSEARRMQFAMNSRYACLDF